MATTKLSRLLELFLAANKPLSLGYIALRLDTTPEMAESMLAFWVQRGRIVRISGEADCGLCGLNGACPYVYQFPAAYELTAEDRDR